MANSFELSAESPASVEQVHSAFGDEGYWLARLAAFGGVHSLDSLILGTDGTVDVVISQDLRSHRLPALAAKLLPDDLKVLHTETWKPIDGGRVGGEVNFRVPRGLGSGGAAALLTPMSNGSRLTFSVTVEVRVPLVGGKLEGYLGNMFVDGIPEVQRFTSAWIAEHTCR